MTRFATAALTAALLLLVGCATTRLYVAGIPISGASALAGRWAGTVTPGRWSAQDPFALTITPDGQLTATWDSDTAWGNITIQNGRATFGMHPPVYEGTVRLYENGGQRELVLEDDWQSFKARVAPVN